MGQPGTLLALSRSDAPATSNVCLFHIDGYPQYTFCAYAVDGGTVLVQKVNHSTMHSMQRCRLYKHQKHHIRTIVYLQNL